jgi:hypothetical protein
VDFRFPWRAHDLRSPTALFGSPRPLRLDRPPPPPSASSRPQRLVGYPAHTVVAPPGVDSFTCTCPVEGCHVDIRVNATIPAPCDPPLLVDQRTPAIENVVQIHSSRWFLATGGRCAHV